MKHYTISHLFLFVTTLILYSAIPVHAQDYKLYSDCEEYYDSRGFYHNKCKPNKFKQKDAMKSFNQLYDLIEPGKGPKPLEDTNAAKPIDDLFGGLKKKEDKSKKSLFEEDNEADELTQPDDDGKQVKSNNKALKERPKLEFGRE